MSPLLNILIFDDYPAIFLIYFQEGITSFCLVYKHAAAHLK